MFDRWFRLGYFVLPFHVDLAFQGTFCGHLAEACVKHSEADGTECEDASDKKETSTPPKNPLDSGWETSPVQL